MLSPIATAGSAGVRALVQAADPVEALLDAPDDNLTGGSVDTSPHPPPGAQLALLAAQMPAGLAVAATTSHSGHPLEGIVQESLGGPRAAAEVPPEHASADVPTAPKAGTVDPVAAEHALDVHHETGDHLAVGTLHATEPKQAFGNALGQSIAEQARGPGTAPAATSSEGEYKDTWRDENLARMRRLAGAENSTGAGVDWNAGTSVMGAGPGAALPSMFPASQLVGSGRNAQGLRYYEWANEGNIVAVATEVPPQPALAWTELPPPAVEGTGLRSGSIRADQGWWSSMDAIANSNLSFGEKFSMGWGAIKYYFRNSDEAQGAVQMIGGGLEVAGAVTLSSTGLGATLGVPLAFHGGDNIGTGFNRFMGYGNNPTVTYQLVESATGSPAVASAVDQGIPLLGGVATVGQGLRLAESRVFNNTAYRGLTPQDAAALDDGLGLTAKNPNGVWTAEDHVANFRFGTKGGALQNDPWIGTTRDYDVVIGPNGYDSGNGIVAINLNRVPNAQVEVWQTTARSNTYMLSEPYHRSIWAQEVSIYQSVPARVIYSPFTPITQVPVHRPITYGLTLGGTGFTTNRGGSQ